MGVRRIRRKGSRAQRDSHSVKVQTPRDPAICPSPHPPQLLPGRHTSPPHHDCPYRGNKEGLIFQRDNRIPSTDLENLRHFTLVQAWEEVSNFRLMAKTLPFSREQSKGRLVGLSHQNHTRNLVEERISAAPEALFEIYRVAVLQISVWLSPLTLSPGLHLGQTASAFNPRSGPQSFTFGTSFWVMLWHV